jgi:hypothetical protein
MFELMQSCLDDFCVAIPAPEFVEMSFGSAFRYKEKDIYQAMVQKLARLLSALRATQLLLENGFVQEQGVMQRMIDETNDDILFLVYAVTNDTITDLHQRFLDAFWEEEIDESGDLMQSAQNRPMIPRRKILAYIAKMDGAELDESRGIELYKTISKAYSGFVHGASPHLMEMYGDDPGYFHTAGMLGTPRMAAHADDFWNYMYRGFLSFMFVAKAFGDARYVEDLNEWAKRFEENEGKEY